MKQCMHWRLHSVPATWNHRVSRAKRGAIGKPDEAQLWAFMKSSVDDPRKDVGNGGRARRRDRRSWRRFAFAPREQHDLLPFHANGNSGFIADREIIRGVEKKLLPPRVKPQALHRAEELGRGERGREVRLGRADDLEILRAEQGPARPRLRAGRRFDRRKGKTEIVAPRRDVARDEVRRAEKARHERARRAVIHLGRTSRLLDTSLAHDDQLVSEGERLGLVVRHVHGREGERAEKTEELGSEVLPEFRVECGERFVEEQNARPEREGARERHALLLAAGEPVDGAALEAPHPDRLENLAGARRALGLPHAARAEPERNVLKHGEMRKERVALEHHPDVALLGGDVRDVPPIQQHRARIGIREPRDHPEGRALPRAARPEQRGDPALREDVTQRHDRCSPGAVGLRQPAHFQLHTESPRRNSSPPSAWMARNAGTMGARKISVAAAGNVCTIGVASRKLTLNSPHDTAKTRSAESTSPGTRRGRVTHAAVFQGPAPRERATRSRSAPSLSSALLTVFRTSGRVYARWPATRRPKRGARPAPRSSPTASAMPGIASGVMASVSREPEPGNGRRRNAKAAGVPMRRASGTTVPTSRSDVTSVPDQRPSTYRNRPSAPPAAAPSDLCPYQSAWTKAPAAVTTSGATRPTARATATAIPAVRATRRGEMGRLTPTSARRDDRRRR